MGGIQDVPSLLGLPKIQMIRKLSLNLCYNFQNNPNPLTILKIGTTNICPIYASIL